MKIDEAGTYKIEYTATDECGNSTTEDRLVTVTPPPVYGVIWDGSESPAWTRTDLAANFPDPEPAVANGTGQSPFDNIMPWSGMQIVEDAEAGTLVSIPKFYYKWTSSAPSMKLQISPSEMEGFSVSPAHADRGDGLGERDVVYVGRYHCSSVDYKSTTGVMPKVSTPQSDFISNISAISSSIWMEDFPLFWTIRMLYLVEFANWDSQGMIGVGGSPENAVFQSGVTDNMQYHTGTSAEDRATGGAVQYRHIENLWANVQESLAGTFVRVSGGSTPTASLLWEKNPQLYQDGSDAVVIRDIMPNASGTITSWNIAFSEHGLHTPTNIITPEDNTKYVCDLYGKFNASGYLTVGGYYYNGLSGMGLFRIACTSQTSQNAFSSSRIQKLP